MNGYRHVAIDGPAGSGKTTVARALARRLGVLYLDTGAMYRGVAVIVMEAAADAADEAGVLRLEGRRPVRVVLDEAAPDGFRVFAGDTVLGDELYRNDVSTLVSVVAAHPGVRALLVERQREIASHGPVVMAGRDIGTVVLPQAPVKVFLTATVDERVDRRLAELAEHGVVMDRAILRAEMVERDRIDTERDVAPLRPADGAVEIDSTGLSVLEVVDLIAGLVGASRA